MIFTFGLCVESFSQSDREFVFFSNLGDADQFNSLISKMDDSENQTLVSLGDNSLLALSELKAKFKLSKHIYLLGDNQQSLLTENEIISKKKASKLSCPNPIVKEVSDNTIMIVMNSAWFMERELRFKSLNHNCEYINELQVIEALESVFDDYPEHQKIVVAHHGIHSFSEIVGRGISANNFIPIYGQLYNGYRKNIGKQGDLAKASYKKYHSLLKKFLSDYKNVIFVSGHDYLNFIDLEDGMLHINVNSGPQDNAYAKSENVKFLSTEPNILRIKNSNEKLSVEFESNSEKYEDFSFLDYEFDTDSKEVVEVAKRKVEQNIPASVKYGDGKLKTRIMGQGYRKEWGIPIQADILNVDDYDGGLEPYAQGGGLQTRSIKFKSGNGRKYAFRLLDKEPEKSLTDLFRESVYKNIIVELITTMHPYSPLVANHILDQTDILHIKPELFILNDHPSLKGEYGFYVGKLGTLEIKPKGKSKNLEGFGGAHDVLTSYEMLAQLKSSHNHKLDKMSYAKARLMDMYLGDWDRHEDNWKWAEFKDGKKHTYKPIPKDRDHVFSKWTGIIPTVADFAVANAEDFDYKFGNVRHLNFKGRFLDRELAGELSKSDWLDAAKYLQDAISDEAIHNAVQKIPKEALGFHGEEIEQKLLSRKEDLPNLVDKYYEELNPYVDIVGTSKRDKFRVASVDDNLLVEIYHKDDADPYFERVIECGLIDNINLYGLGSDDEFVIDCIANHKTNIHIVGGDGKDVVRLTKKTNVPDITVFDSYKEDVIDDHSSIQVKSPARIPHYNPYSFNYNFLSPTGTLVLSSGNGFGFGLGANYFKRGFNKPDFATKTGFKFVLFPALGIFRIDGKQRRTHFYKLLDLVVSARYSSLYDKFPFFYGLGNDSEFIRPNRNSVNRIDYDFINFDIGLVKDYDGDTFWETRIGFENHNVGNFQGNQAFQDTTIIGFGVEQYYKINSILNLDYTDNRYYPTNGAKLSFDVTGRYNTTNDVTGNFNTRFSYYRSFRLGLLVTFAGTADYRTSFGDAAFYHQSILGSQTDFRGFTRNRFIDDNALLFNTELRFRVGTIRNRLIPTVVGFFLLTDNGKVWNSDVGFSNNDWNTSFGGGAFLAPVHESYSLKFSLLRTDERTTYFEFKLGLDF